MEFIATYFCCCDKPRLEGRLQSSITKEVFARSVHPEDNSFQSCFHQILGHRAAPLPLLLSVKAIMGHPTLSACKESHFKSAKKKKNHLQILILSVENNVKGKRVLVDSSTQLINGNKDSRQVALVTSVTVQKWWPRCSPPLHWTLLSLRRTCRNGNNSTSIL